MALICGGGRGEIERDRERKWDEVGKGNCDLDVKEIKKNN